jgi:tRNA-modifying protein YgfZ
LTDAFGAWIERDVVRASGPDAMTFLQGQLSQDVEGMATGDSRWSLLLEPSGKVTAWLRITREGDDTVVLDVDGGWGAAVIARLERFKLRTKCDLERVDGWRCLAVRGVSVAASGTRALPIVWPGVDGADLLGPDVQVPADTLITVPPSSEDHENDESLEKYERLRIAAGVPAMGRELTDATIPVEAGQWLIDASVSFTKGCYTGQELVARIDARGGNAPRPVRGLRIEGATNAIRAGASVSSLDGRALGTLTSVARVATDAIDGDAYIALAPLARAVAPPADVVVDGHAAHVVELPMRLSP